MFVVPNQYYKKHVTQQYNFLKLPAISGGLSYISQTKSTCTIRFSTQFGTQLCHITYKHTKRTHGWSCAGT